MNSSAGEEAKFGTQQTFRRHDDERLDEVALHLTPQDMKILRRGGHVADLDVVLGAGLQKTLESRAGMFGTLTFIAVRKQQHNPTRPLPFRFRRDDELIDNGLRAIGEIAELRFPQTKHLRIIERVTVIEPEHRSLREWTVVNANARLFLGEMHERHVRFARLCVVKNRVPRAKSAARAILA